MYAAEHSRDAEAHSTAFALLEARRRGMERTVQALLREGLLRADHLIFEGAFAWLPLWNQQSILRFDGLELGRARDCRLNGAVSHYRAGERPRPLATPVSLLAHVAPSLGANEADLQRLLAEIDNSVNNDALCLQFRHGWRNRLVSRFGLAHGGNFIAALRESQEPNPALLLEQWGALGHPWHPNHKTKLGLSAQEVMAWSPEFEARLGVGIAAIREDVAHVECVDQRTDWRGAFAASFPQTWLAWSAALRERGEDAARWLPLPIHPLQMQRTVPELFADELRAGELLLLPGVTLPVAPTMSFRTVVPEASATQPHLKLPVSLRLTSVQRTVSPKSAVMGPRLTRLLRRIVADEGGFGGTLAIAGEELGLHYLDPRGDDDRSRHLSALMRSNPGLHRAAGRFPVPVGALFADSPLSGRPLVADLVALAFGDGPDGAQAFYRRYCTTALRAVLGPYLIYGIAFEAHQQNSFVLVDEAHQPAQMLLRDFGDLRIHTATLNGAGHTLEAFRSGHTLFDDAEKVRDKLLHAFMLCHLGELGRLLANEWHADDGIFWDLLGDEVQRALEHYRPRTHAERWQAEHDALLLSDWPAKAFLRMRLADCAEDVVRRMPNPLKRAI